MRFKFQAPWHHIFEHEGQQHRGGDVFEADESVASADSRLVPTDEDVTESRDVGTITQSESQPSAESPQQPAIPPAQAPVPPQDLPNADNPDNTNVGEGDERQQDQRLADADARDEATMQQFNVTQQGQQQS